MPDTNIDIGFNTNDLKESLNGIGANVGGGLGAQEGISKGFTTALKGAGLIAILSEIKVVMDSINFTLGIISSLIGFIVTKFVQGLFKFFDDPVRALLELGVFITNRTVDAINLVVTAINALIPGTRFDIPLLPELNVEDVIRSYDEAKEAAKLLAEGLVDSISNFDLTVKTGATVLQDKVVESFTSFEQVLDLIIKKGGDFVSRDPTFRGAAAIPSPRISVRDAVSLIGGGNQSRDVVVEQKRRDANKILKFLN